MDAPWRIPLLLFLFFTLLYGVTMPGYVQISDSEFSMKTARALVERGTFELQPAPGKEGYLFFRDGRAFSKFGVGLALLWVPFVVIADGISAVTGLPGEFVTHFVLSTYSVFAGAAGCVVFFLLARALGATERTAVLVTFAFGAGTVLWKYSVYDFSEVAQSLFLMGATLAAWRNTPGSIAAMTVLLSCNVWTKVASAVYVPLFLLYVALRNRGDVRALLQRFDLSGCVGAVFAGGLLYLNWLRFGSPLESGYGEQAAMFSDHKLHNALSLLLSLEKGALFYSPILVVGAAGFPLLWRRGRLEALLLAGLVAVATGFHAIFVYWEGGWCWGPRFLVPVTFAMLLPAVLLLEAKTGTRRWFTAVFVLSAAVQVLAVLVKDQEYLTLREVLHTDAAHPLPSPIPGHAVLLKHKLTQRDNVYALREFGLDSDTRLDASGFSTFVGLNLWYLHVARSLQRPWIQWLPLLTLPFFAWLLVSLRQAIRRSDEQSARPSSFP